MYKKAEKYISIKKENMEIERISEEEEQNIRGIGEAATRGTTSFFIFAGFGLGTIKTHININYDACYVCFYLCITWIYNKYYRGIWSVWDTYFV